MNETTSTPIRWEDRLPRLGLAIDLSMVALVIINLIWIVFDSLFSFTGMQAMLATIFGDGFVTWYDERIHAWFFAYDLVFVSIFITELLARWIYAIRYKLYSHWAAYPLIHWYDVLGCIPVGSFRALRVLRIIAILVRLQRLGIIDYTQWGLYQLFYRWYNIALEELSDRIAIKILEGVQIELRQGEGLEKKVLERVVLPRKQLLIDVISNRLAHSTAEIYGDSRADLEAYIKRIVGKAIHHNMEIRTMERIPMLGSAGGKLLEHIVTDIVCQSLTNAVHGMQSDEFKLLVADITDAVLDTLAEPQSDDASAVTDALSDLLEVIKDELRIQRWKEDTQTL